MSSVQGPISRTPYSAQIIASTNNIPTAYSSAAGSVIIASGLLKYRFHHVAVINETASEISFCVSATGVPSSTTNTRVFIPANTTFVADQFIMQDSAYIQSETGSAIVVGQVEVQFW
jgi:hypothetical protein